MQLKIPKHIIYYLAAILNKSYRETFSLIVINANIHKEAAERTFAFKKTQRSYTRKFVIAGLPDHMYLKANLYSDWRNHAQLANYMSVSMPAINGNINMNFQESLDDAMYAVLEETLFREDTNCEEEV